MPTTTPDETPASVRGEVIAPNRPDRSGTAPRELDGRKVIARFVGVVARVPRYLKLGWRLVQDPTVSGKGKAALAGGLAYAISPIDPVPGFIPVLGQLDDLAILLLAVRTALMSCQTDVADRQLREAGLSWEILERDLLTLRATAIWLAHRGGSLALRVGKAVMSAATARLKAGLPGAASVSGASPAGISSGGPATARQP